MHRSGTIGRQKLEICALYLIDFMLAKAVVELHKLKLGGELLTTTRLQQLGRGRIPFLVRQSRLNV